MKVLLIALFSLSVFSSNSFANISVSPFYVNFGSVKVGQSGFRKTIYVNNRSDKATYINVGGSCYGDFNVVNFCYGYLQAYAGCNIYVDFRPNYQGMRSCSISVRDDSGFGEYIQVNGNGI